MLIFLAIVVAIVIAHLPNRSGLRRGLRPIPLFVYMVVKGLGGATGPAELMNSLGKTIPMASLLRKTIGLLFGLGVLLVLLSVVAAIVSVLGPGRPYASPTAMRPWGLDEWEKLTGPPKAVPPMDRSLLDMIAADIKPSFVRIEYDSVPRLRRGDVLYTIVDQTSEGKEPAESRPRLKLLFLGVGWIDSLTPEDKEKGFTHKLVPLRFFDPSGSLLTEKQVREDYGYGDRNHIRHAALNTVVLNFYFDLHGLESPKIVDSKLFDERTRALVSYGSSWHNFKSAPYSISKRVALWRSTPLVLSVDAAHGPTETREMEPGVGQQALFSNVGVRLIAAVDAGSHSSGWGSRNMEGGLSRQYITFELTPPKKGGESLFLFSVSPACLGRVIDIEALDVDGKRIEDCYSNANAHVIKTRIGEPVEKVSRFRLIYRPFLTRFVVRANGVPGMPPENNSVRDLFDVRVPYACVKRRSDLELLVIGPTELRLSWKNSTGGKAPAGFFPREYHNATPRDFLNDLALILSEQKMEVDSRDGRIVVTGPKQGGAGGGNILQRMMKAIREWF